MLQRHLQALGSKLPDGQTLKSGEDKLADKPYLQHGVRLPDLRALDYELRMIDEWFGKTFASAK